MDSRFEGAEVGNLADLLEGQTVGPATPLAECAGSKIGRYKVMQLIGEGGFGSVFMAEQESPVVRRVALKVIKLGMDTKQVIARFAAERQALAMMDHPNIAKVLDAGSTESGRPYFVMELVPGIPFTEYCDRKRLTLRRRIELFIPVCRAVQHAHQKGIIHRDLKPSNILVMTYDGKPVPKVIDFGVAKALHQRLTEKTLFTQFGNTIGTPEYMSPEQADMDVLGSDTRSDIYWLGVLLYELLTGGTPLDRTKLREAGYAQMLRMIRDEEPLKPSTRLTQSGDALASVSEERGTNPTELPRLTAGDLDWIVMKCLEKDRARRYETAEGLARDLERYLDDEPVDASPPSASDQFRRLLRRHKSEAIAVTAITVALLVGMVVSTFLFLGEREARHRAVVAEEIQARLRRESDVGAARSRQVVHFLEEMLKGVGPSVALGRDTTMLREILDKTAKSLDDIRDQPAVEAELRSILGNVYIDLSDLPHAADMHGKALEIRRKLVGSEDLGVAQSLYDLGRTLVSQAKQKEGEAALRQSLVIRRHLLGEENAEVADTLKEIATSLRWREGHAEETESLCRQSLAMRRKLSGNENPQVAFTLNELGTYLRKSKPVEAEAMCRESVALSRKLFGREHPFVASSLFGLGLVLTDEKKYDEAEAVHREALVMRRKLLPRQHRDLAGSLSCVGELLEHRGELAQAEVVEREALAIFREVLGTESGYFAEVLQHLARVMWRQGKLAEAQPLLLELSEWSLAHPDGLPQFGSEVINATPNTLSCLIACCRGLGEPEKGVEWESKLHAIINKKVQANPSNVRLVTEMGDLCALTGWLEEAGADFHKAIDLTNLRLARSAGTTQAASLFNARAGLFFRLSKFPEALADYRRAVELEPANLLYWHDCFVPLLMQTDDIEGYRHWRSEELRRFRNVLEGDAAHRAAKDACMMPLEGEDLKIAVELADRSVAVGKLRWCADETKGMTEYRGGHFEEAIPYLLKSRDVVEGQVWAPLTEFFLAMAYEKVGDHGHAWAALARGVKAREEHPGVGQNIPDLRGLSAAEWVFDQAAYREARKLIYPDGPTTRSTDSTQPVW